jgi:hypothetical protein
MTPLEEIDRTGNIGPVGFGFILSRIPMVAKAGNFPPPSGHSSWTKGAAADWFSDEFLPRKGVEFALKIRVNAVNDESFEKITWRAISNALKDEAKATSVGKLRSRMRGLLADVVGVVDATSLYAGKPAWTLDSFGDQIYAGDHAELLEAPALRSIGMIASLNTAGPTSAENAGKLISATRILLEIAGGALTDQVLASLLVVLFELETVEAFVIRDNDMESEPISSTKAAPDDRAQILEGANVVWGALSHDERLAVPYLDGKIDDLARAVPHIGAPAEFAEELKVKLKNLAQVHELHSGALDVVIKRCMDLRESA